MRTVGAIGLNLLTGSTGQISLGQSGFLAAGCYTTGLLITDYHWPPELALPMAGIVAAALSFLVGIPSLRLKGLYLAITSTWQIQRQCTISVSAFWRW